MMPKTNSTIVYLHIGPRKTGTTTIQRSLFINEDKLLSNNLLVPPIGRPFQKTAAHHNLGWEFINPNYYNPNLGGLSDLIEYLNKRIEKKVILSSETFSSLSFDQIINVKQYLRDFRVKIIVYIRRQDQLLQSMWMQALKSGEFGYVELDFIEWLENNQDFIKFHGLDYKVLIEKWGLVFGKKNLLIRVLEKNQIKGSLFDDFLQTCGVFEIDIYQKAKDQNLSPGIKTITLIRELRKRLEGKLTREERVIFYKQINKYGNISGWNTKANFITKQVYNQIMKHYENDNRIIAQEFLNRDNLFLDPFQEKEVTQFTTNDFEVQEILTVLSFVVENFIQQKKRYIDSQKMEEIEAYKKQLQAIYSTRGWKILQKYRAFRKKFNNLFRKLK